MRRAGAKSVALTVETKREDVADHNKSGDRVFRRRRGERTQRAAALTHRKPLLFG